MIKRRIERRRNVVFIQVESTHQKANYPDEDDYNEAVLFLEFKLERMKNDVVAIEADGDESEYADVDAERRREWRHFAHDVGKDPALK